MTTNCSIMYSNVIDNRTLSERVEKMPVTFEIKEDVLLGIEQILSLEDELQGIYILRNVVDEPLYVGQTSDLKKRIKQHIGGTTNTSAYIYAVQKASLIYETDIDIRLAVEAYLIRKFSDTVRNRINFWKYKNLSDRNFYPVVRPRMFGVCKAITTSGERCRRYAHSNGFCNVHGGDGITGLKIQELALEEYIQNHPELFIEDERR